jgi:hypothetical protein
MQIDRVDKLYDKKLNWIKQQVLAYKDLSSWYKNFKNNIKKILRKINEEM